MHVKKGFTLVELLVVVAVIGAIASVILVSLNNARQKAHNARLVSQFQQMEKAFMLTFLDENRTEWWRESELGLGSDPTLKKIIEIESGPLATFSDYFPHETIKDDILNSVYRYDHDTVDSSGCGGGVSNWNRGVNLTVNGLTLDQKYAIDEYIDKDTSPICGKITYGDYEGGSLYWRVSDTAEVNI